ncbi:hypothetical protein GALMADRAFT_106020 [Galerina marginata CBS 339.88]|uniref:CxC2-like cysteine cluster KDZ transposase-associated domain-containing protein n=1 Tax=Galerina marginata (strain CBS 339.88) TaxID=685588 RepID=A0A067S827_GALM3|nr:hypothetical protein GALMADRAFT_106020 [Galerina marginata CBS 339.88]
MDTTGLHEIALDFCNCEHRQPQFIQLLRFGWFPATVGFPHTASTLRLLKFFQMLSFESKASAYEFYQTLSRLTDNTGTKIPRDRYRTLLRIIREYRHIKMLKRAGRGHSVGGAAGTTQGECAVICPACPHPGINLPNGWEKAPENMRFLYTLFLAIDANFRLKRKMVSSHASDPSLSHGWSYFVEENDFKDFLAEYGPIIVQAPSTCSNHNAVNKNNGEAGFAATGAGCVDDARHDMKRPCAVGDLQKGERYINMDYLFCSTLRDNDLVEVVVSYDIACQWSINLWERFEKYPSWMHVDPNGKKTFRYLVPKFHLPAHVKKCQTKYSFNYNPNVGRTEGEGVERGWSHINPVATSTREMGPGARRDTLDDHFGDWNWVKTTKMVPEMVEHSQNHMTFSASLPPDDVAQWAKELSDWEQDHNNENPYEARSKAMSQDAVRRKLAESEEKELQAGTGFTMHENTSASQLITIGLSLEDEQYLLRREAQSLGTHTTDNQQAKLKLQSNASFRKIKSWIQIQQLYVPVLGLIRARESQKAETEPKPQDIRLYLPSSMPRTTPCDDRLRNIEWELRKSQCIDALDDLRESLRLKSHIIIYKSKNWRGQQANTRAQKIISRNQINIEKAAYTYRLARDALARLAPILEIVGWEGQFPRLREDDIKTLEADSQKTRKEMKNNKVGEGRRKMSWIWTQPGVGGDMTEDERLHESKCFKRMEAGLRIEWCKGKARQDRWKEEVQLLLEEKRRILEFFEWRVQDWEEKGRDKGEWMLPGVAKDDPSIDGRRAYAKEQANQFRQMQSYCVGLWKDIDSFVVNEGKDKGLVLREANADDDADDDDYIPPPPLYREDD